MRACVNVYMCACAGATRCFFEPITKSVPSLCRKATARSGRWLSHSGGSDPKMSTSATTTHTRLSYDDHRRSRLSLGTCFPFVSELSACSHSKSRCQFRILKHFPCHELSRQTVRSRFGAFQGRGFEQVRGQKKESILRSKPFPCSFPKGPPVICRLHGIVASCNALCTSANIRFVCLDGVLS